MEEVLLLPLVQARQDLHQIGGRSRPLAAMTGGVIFPVEIPHGVASILKRLHPRIMHVAMTSIMVSPEWAKNLIRFIR